MIVFITIKIVSDGRRVVLTFFVIGLFLLLREFAKKLRTAIIYLLIANTLLGFDQIEMDVLISKH